MEVLHTTPFETSLDAILDKDGSEARVAILKATYAILDDGTLSVAQSQVPIVRADIFTGAPGVSSVLSESDGAFFKLATDIVIVGNAYAPRGRRVTEFQASLRVGRLAKTVTVVGDRVWYRGGLGEAAISKPTPFDIMPLRWEKSFGGADTRNPDSARHGFESRNPIGTGFALARPDDGMRLPNFEHSERRIRDWWDRPPPQGFGFVGRSWQPRITFAGTYDERWQRERMPILPEDFDYRFFNGAPSDQIYPGYLQGGEPVMAVNLSRRGGERVTLPSLQVRFLGSAIGRPFDLEARLDTVILDLDVRRLIMTWRSKYRVSQRESADQVRAVVSFPVHTR